MPFKVLGSPYNGFKCKTCDFITINKDKLRKHCKKIHQQVWKGEQSILYDAVKVQSFFRTGGLQRYFVVALSVAENGEISRIDQVVQQQLASYETTRQKALLELQVLEDAAKTDKTSWFKRTGWLEHLKDRNLVHLAHQARLPDQGEVRLKLAAQLTERLIERSVKGLSTLAREARRWLRSAQQHEVDQRPLARLQNPESQATYAGYMIKFVCYYLRIIADEEAQGRGCC